MEHTREDIKGLIQVIIKQGFKEAAAAGLKKVGASSLSGIDDVELGVAYDALLEEWGAAQLKKKPLGKFERWKYGERWPAFSVETTDKKGKKTVTAVRPLLDVEIEMRMFIAYEEDKWLPGGMGKYEHCKRGVEIIWSPQSRKPVLFNPYAERMFKAFCEHKFLGIGGHASGGKSFNPAVWAIWNFLCEPWNTKILVTSTTLKDSKGRIWGDILELWDAAAAVFGGDMPGKPVPSEGHIRCVIGDRSTDKAGITLLAGDKSKDKETIGKMIGFKRKRLILICDEMPDLSESVTNAAEANLINNPWFQMIGIGNFASFYDPLGKFCEPVNGWATVNESMTEWQGVKAHVIRFDAKHSPNVEAAERGDMSNRWFGLLKWQDYEDNKKRLGENSPGFYRMYRAFPCPTGSIEAIYSEEEIISYQADKPAGHGWTWKDIPVNICGLDPAFKNGGDRAIAYFAKVGMSSKRVMTFCLTEYLILEQNINDSEDKSMQIIRQLAAAMERRGVLVSNLGVDVSGAAAFGTLISQHIGQGFLAVEFGGKPSDMPVSSIDKRPAKDVYDRKVAELWHVGKELITTDQFKGIHPDMVKEMVVRTYGTTGNKIWVESKRDMKKRTGFSPDISDGAFVALDVARMRHGLTSGAKAKQPERTDDGPVESPWAAWSRQVRETETFFGQTFTYGG